MSESLSERKKRFLEDCCGCGPTMSGGDAMYTGGADPEGPVAGYDPTLGGKKRKKSPVEMAKKLRKEGYKTPDLSMHQTQIHKIRDKHDNTEYKNDKEKRAGYEKADSKENKLWNQIDRVERDQEEMRKTGRGKERANRMRGMKKGKTKDISIMSRNAED